MKATAMIVCGPYRDVVPYPDIEESTTIFCPKGDCDWSHDYQGEVPNDPYSPEYVAHYREAHKEDDAI